MHGRVFQATPAALLCFSCLSGCNDSRPPVADPPLPMAKLASHFDKETTGTISGQVQWDDILPEVPSLLMRTNPPVAIGKSCPNPNAPAIDAGSKGIGNAVVFLRGIDAQKARPWDHPAVRVELRDLSVHVRQGETDSRVGIVRRGAAIEMVSRESIFHALEARGTSFFSLRFVDQDKPTTRDLHDKGLVELRSAAGYFWMRAYLLVDDHPYYARTDPQGRFAIPRVPPGKYEVVCWMPNWHVVRKERDPESSLTRHLVFAPPLERVGEVMVEARETSDVYFRIAAADFPR